MKIQLKRVYETFDPDDGKRILVDRLWPRGIRKEQLQLDEWMKEIAPSPALRQWFAHQPERFEEFSIQYEIELTEQPLQNSEMRRLSWIAAQNPITLLYAAKDPIHNHARVLRNLILHMMK